MARLADFPGLPETERIRECGVSSTIYESLSFGCGKLDFNGFWEFGCPDRARAHEKRWNLEPGSCWPHTEDYLHRQGFPPREER